MSKKNKKEKKLETKPLLASQIKLLSILVQQFNQANALWLQRKQAIDDAVTDCIIELNIPETQIGEWGLSQDGKSLVRYGKRRKRPVIGTTVKNRQKKKKPTKSQEDEPDE